MVWIRLAVLVWHEVRLGAEAAGGAHGAEVRRPGYVHARVVAHLFGESRIHEPGFEDLPPLSGKARVPTLSRGADLGLHQGLVLEAVDERLGQRLPRLVRRLVPRFRARTRLGIRAHLRAVDLERQRIHLVVGGLLLQPELLELSLLPRSDLRGVAGHLGLELGDHQTCAPPQRALRPQHVTVGMVPDVEQFVAPTQAKQLLQVKPVSALEDVAGAEVLRRGEPSEAVRVPQGVVPAAAARPPGFRHVFCCCQAALLVRHLRDDAKEAKVAVLHEGRLARADDHHVEALGPGVALPGGL
mmetsp:Transcript_4739/g.11124  ORF Transcript_4739/g.11124 Transcript_4739/m.11124 type:complete len:299 (+) Transcript_4739:24-920(+)